MRRLLTSRESLQGSGEAASMLCVDTKKMYIPAWKYTIISYAMSIRLVEGG
jgi:hypothetical protein